MGCPGWGAEDDQCGPLDPSAQGAPLSTTLPRGPPLPQAGEDRKGIPLAPLPNPATYPRLQKPAYTLPIPVIHAAPTQGRTGRPWGRGTSPLGMETRQPGLQHWYRLNPDPMQKRIVTGGPSATYLLFRSKGRPSLVSPRRRKAGRRDRLPGARLTALACVLRHATCALRGRGGMVDTPDLKSGGGIPVRVRVPPPAPVFAP